MKGWKAISLLLLTATPLLIVLVFASLSEAKNKDEVPANARRLIDSHVCLNCDLHGADLSGANLVGDDLTHANLIGANLNKAKLNNAILTDAKLNDANLIGTDLGGSDLSGAVLTGAAIDKTTNLKDANTSGAIGIKVKELKGVTYLKETGAN